MVNICYLCSPSAKSEYCFLMFLADLQLAIRLGIELSNEDIVNCCLLTCGLFCWLRKFSCSSRAPDVSIPGRARPVAILGIRPAPAGHQTPTPRGNQWSELRQLLVFHLDLGAWEALGASHVGATCPERLLVEKNVCVCQRNNGTTYWLTCVICTKTCANTYRKNPSKHSQCLHMYLCIWTQYLYVFVCLRYRHISNACVNCAQYRGPLKSSSVNHLS